MVGGEGDDHLWESGRGAIGGVDAVPLQGAIAECYGWGGGDDQLWGSGRGAFHNTKIVFLLSGVYAGII